MCGSATHPGGGSNGRAGATGGAGNPERVRKGKALTVAAVREIVIVGGGHNALVAAFYLAQKGLKPLVLERRAMVGGAAVTEEFHPGFRCSTRRSRRRTAASFDCARHAACQTRIAEARVARTTCSRRRRTAARWFSPTIRSRQRGKLSSSRRMTPRNMSNCIKCWSERRSNPQRTVDANPAGD